MRVKIACICLALLNILAAVAGYETVYYDFVVNEAVPAMRLSVIHEPFTGKLFNIDPEQVEEIDVDRFNGKGYRIFRTRSAKEQLAGYLNGFRYRYWSMGQDDRHSRLGGPPSIRIFMKDGGAVGLQVTEDMVRVEGIHYHCGRGYIEGLERVIEACR